MQCNIPEERVSHLQRDGSLGSRNIGPFILKML